MLGAAGRWRTAPLRATNRRPIWLAGPVHAADKGCGPDPISTKAPRRHGKHQLALKKVHPGKIWARVPRMPIRFRITFEGNHRAAASRPPGQLAYPLRMWKGHLTSPALRNAARDNRAGPGDRNSSGSLSSIGHVLGL